MTEEFEVNPAEQQVEVRPSAGKMLAESRERLGLSVAEVSRQLRLSPRQIEALETDDHASLPGETFLRGFLRNYAKLLQIDPEALLALCQPEPLQAQSIEVPTSRIEFGGKRRLMPFGDHSGKPWSKYAAIIGVVVLALSWGVYELFLVQSSSQNTPVKSAGETTMVLSLPQAVAPVQTAPVTNQAVETVPATAPETATVAVAPATAEAPVSSAPSPAEVGGQRLQFVFDGDAWVEVKDKGGKVIFYQLNSKGSQQLVRGNPPFSLVIGNAAHVRLTYNDKPIDLAPHIKVDVARLTIE
ncbi:XRE family transcriptional regulator [Sulfuricella denitrificans skB26]|uniref:XRE family transcriptional regulator n=1 Tax=Sulfuricella denitrificans (strain DSM 22764 / NBRC 105220 / skB26) TaxID=1163617 RepID=S6AHJ5_SULDS|nr:RodZ domain-containing protein [Sulfuricella denitrificans]BAN35621.1 XRE family transcriptional regulator [Sulfuricella denitrificans skB26]